MTVFVLHGRQENCQGRDRPVEILCALRKRAHIERNEARARIDFSTTSPGHLSRVTCAVRARGHRTHTHTFGGTPRRKNNIKILAVLQRACQLAFSLSRTTTKSKHPTCAHTHTPLRRGHTAPTSTALEIYSESFYREIYFSRKRKSWLSSERTYIA